MTNLETKKFLKDSNVLAKTLIQVNSNKKKTLKQKAYDAMLKLISSRLDAKLSVLDACITDGSVYLADLSVQKAIYGDVLEFLSKELLDQD